MHIPSKPIHLLFVEDDPVTSHLLKGYLQKEGFQVKHFLDGENAIEHFSKSHKDYKLCILDCMLPGMDGFRTAKEIKLISPPCPIIFLTAMSMKEDKIKGFKIGIDDYITKPFDEEELLFRIRSILRRTGVIAEQGAEEKVFSIGEYIFDYENLSVTINGSSKRITKKEGEILKFLCLNKNQVRKRDDILVHVWGKKDYFLGRSLDVFITKIRKYLKGDPEISIENIHNVGYVLNDRKD